MQARLPAAATNGAPYAIHRYPTRLIEQALLADGRVALLRPVLPQDVELQQAFVRSLTPLSRRRRFFGPLNELPDAVARYMSEVDYQSHLALLAEAMENDIERQIAEARWVRRSDESDTADFAIAVADDWQRVGLGARLMKLLMQSAAAAGIKRLCGDILADNLPMRAWLRRAGWCLQLDPYEGGLLNAMIDLRSGSNLPLQKAA